MKRLWAVLLTAATLVSCRSAQPTTNPFMRTTVAPPATTPGVIVTPGQPYAQGISPPMITSPAPPPVTVAPVAPAPVAPVMPPPAVAPMVAPPPVTPNGAKFHPPGGDYLFHQSSHERPAANAQAGQVQLASAIQPPAALPAGATQQRTVVHCGYAPPSDEPLPARMQADGTVINPYVKTKPAPISKGIPVVPQADGTILNPYVKTKPAAPKLLPLAAPRRLAPAPRQTPMPVTRQAPATPATAAARPAAAMSTPRLTFAVPREQPPTDMTAISVGDSSQTSTLRILGESTSGAAAVAKGKPPATGEPPVLRITANESAPSLRTTVHSDTDSSGADLAIRNPPTKQNSASLVAPEAAPAVVRAAFQPAASSATTGGDYAHSPDYKTLRGKLEYSPSLRQWKLRYISIDGRTDAYGGSVILPDAPALAAFKSGDLVEIRGALPAARISSGGFAPQYAPTSIERIAR